MKAKKIDKEIEKLNKIVSDLLTGRVELERQISSLSDKVRILELQVILDALLAEQSKQCGKKFTGTIYKNCSIFEPQVIRHTLNIYEGTTNIYSYTGNLCDIDKKINYEKDNPCGYGNATPKNEIVSAIYAYMYNKSKNNNFTVAPNTCVSYITNDIATTVSNSVADILSSTKGTTDSNNKTETKKTKKDKK